MKRRAFGLTIAWRAASLLLLGNCWGSSVSSHEVRPAFLQITERPSGYCDVLWKQPIQGAFALHLVPHISGGLLEGRPNTIQAASDFQISVWRNVYSGTSGLEGRTLSIDGLGQTITDVLVAIRLANGDSVQKILVPQRPTLTLQLHQNRPDTLEFLTLGIRHILTGPDHLLFLFALLLIVRDRWMLFKTVGAFTLAHSLTLALTTLGNIRLSTPLLNALIALSILFAALEALRAQRGDASLTIRYPWVVAFAFGLVHGMGFAVGLTSLKLEHGTLWGALLFFNLGVEAGQLVFIAVFLALQRSLRLLEFVWPRSFQVAQTYVIGTFGAFWTFQYCALLFGTS